MSSAVSGCSTNISSSLLVQAQVTACTDAARTAIEAAGGTVTRVYYTAEGLKGLLKVRIPCLADCKEKCLQALRRPDGTLRLKSRDVLVWSFCFLVKPNSWGMSL